MVQVREDLKKLYDDGYRSIAIVLCHSYTYPEHELQVAALARTLGFAHVSASSQLLPMIKLVPRGVSATADAYLTPVLMAYLDGFFSGFDAKLRRYFDLHAVLDIKHSEEWNKEAIRPIIEDEVDGPARARAMAEGALTRLKCGERCFERYREMLGVA